jgi:NADH:ubiquinone oxidoreductase subunit C
MSRSPIDGNCVWWGAVTSPNCSIKLRMSFLPKNEFPLSSATSRSSQFPAGNSSVIESLKEVCAESRGTYSFVHNLAQKAKNTSLLISASLLSYTATHLRSATLYHSCQLCDIFAYELPSANVGNRNHPVANTTLNLTTVDKAQTSTVVYNFHSFHSQDRHFLFANNMVNEYQSSDSAHTSFNDSITELFPAGNWLEREVAELSGNSFFGKKDMRNLMLQFGDVTAPHQTQFPSIGLRDMFYDPIKQTLVQGVATIQA